MGKKLAIAFACALGSGGASAQIAGTGSAAVTSSSVNLFGIVDTAIAWGEGSLTHVTRMVSGASSSSRLGVRGVEDLGGHLAASFWLEAGLNSDDGTGVAGNTNNLASGNTPTGPVTFNRRSTVSLLGDWGEVRVGRDFTSLYRNRDQTDPFNTNGVGGMLPHVATIGGVTATRASNMVMYILPQQFMHGFFGEAEYYLGEQTDSSAGNGWQARFGYAAKRWGVAAAYARTNNLQTLTTGDFRSWNVGATYDFGAARLSAGYFKDRVQALPSLTGKGFIVGAVVPVGPDQIKASYSQYGTDAPGAPKAKKAAIGYIHNLSKRTSLYATYAHLTNNDASALGLNGASTAPGDSSNGIDLGLKHVF